MHLPSRTDTVVVGAGQAGLAMSHFLANGGRDHVVLERRATLGGGWQDRWDSFQLVTPNWTSALPGQPYDGTDPGGFMPRDEIAGRVARYAETVKAPVALETQVTRLTKPGERFRVETNQGSIEADRVVVATGSFHQPRIPDVAAQLPDGIERLHTHAYRRESALPSGAVLVVGSAQSGVQIAEELHEAGRRVYLSVGSAGRLPRRYRGRDIFEWLGGIALRGGRHGLSLPTRDVLPDPRLKFAGNPHVSGHDGGHDTNLRDFGARGMTLLGRIEAIEGHTLRLAPDLPTKLARADAFFDEQMRPLVERFIEAEGLDVPPDDRVRIDFEPPVLSELDLAEAGISTVIWATGYRLDHRWIDLPIFDELGYPQQQRGVTDVPGLYFLGLMWQSSLASATLIGPTMDGTYLAAQLGLPVPERPRATVA